MGAFWVLSLLLLATSLTSCQEDCLQDGECMVGTLVGVFELETTEECLSTCQQIEGCNIYTHYRWVMAS